MDVRLNRSLRSVRWLLLGFFVLIVAACSSTTFVYNRLDFILPWYLDRYVDLRRDQSKAFDAQLDTLLDWHRREELPRYVAFLDDVSANLASPMTVEQFQNYADRAEQAWFRIRDPALEELLLLAESLTEEQIDDFMVVMNKKQRKYERKYLDRDNEEMREDAVESMEETLEDYLGRLSKAQLARLELAAQDLLRSDVVWLQERRAWSEELAIALERKAGWQQLVRAIVKDWEANLDPEVEALYDHNTKVVQGAIVDVVNGRSEKQNKRVRRKLAQLREDLQFLIDEA